MARIRKLSEELIGKIAAGEVVERPAAAIKELVENSLDAGATRISVDIQDGGKESFRVTDDGSGIEQADIRMAFERHATSKIQNDSDLIAVSTLGFRGEALASIAAVSRVVLTTRTKEQETGLRVTNEGGRITDIREAACAPGTSLLVRDLFYNVPVRRNFLKKTVTEANAVTDLMTHLILSRPDVSFRYTSGGKTIYYSAGDGKMESAMMAVYGAGVIRTLRRIRGNHLGVLVEGFVGIGDNARNNRSGEHFFINHRMLRSPVLSGALEDACRERVMIGKFPICCLHISMPYENINVNVHPNKMEVRFSSDQAVREAVYVLVQEGLRDRDAFERPVEMSLSGKEDASTLPDTIRYGKDGIPELPRAAQVEKSSTVPAVRMHEKTIQPVYRPIEKKTERPILPDPAGIPILPPPQLGERADIQAKAAQESGPCTELVPPQLLYTEGETKTGEPEEHTPQPGKPETADEGITDAATTDTGKPEEKEDEQISCLTEKQPREMRILGALFHTYILVEYADHLLLIDQHAVHERLLFDRMMKSYENQNAGQPLLVPYIVSVTQKDLAILEANRELLEGLGLVVEPFSRNEVAVRSVPVILGQNETAIFLHEAIDELENGRIPGADKKRASILQMACKHAVKGGERLTEDILRSLVEEMIDRKVTPTCPHGRPLVVSISHTDLDKKFKRIQQ